jgi:hypothetical protein
MARVLLFWMLTCILLSAGLFPYTASADSKELNTLEAYIQTDASLVNEINLLDTGQTHVFPSVREDDRINRKFENNYTDSLRNRNTIHLRFTGKLTRVSINIYTRHAYLLNAPESIGLEGFVLFPVKFISPHFLFGFYHDSSHNLDTGKYGNGGSDTTGLHARFLVVNNPLWSLDAWITRNYFKARKTPYFVTTKATEFMQEDLGKIWGEAGVTLKAHKRNKFFHIKPAFHFNDYGKPAFSSFSLRIRAFKINPASNVSQGLFLDYVQNLGKKRLFGRSDFLFGPMWSWQF